MAYIYQNATDKSIGVTGVWTDIDTGAPANAVGVIIRAYTISSSSNDVGLRKKGSTDARITHTFGNCQQDFYVGVDENGYIQGYIETTNQNFYLIGYFTEEDGDFFTNGYDKTPGVTGSWQDVDCSSELPVDAVAAIFEYEGESGYTFGLRKKGSTDDRTDVVFHHMGAIIGLDTNRVCQCYISNAAKKLYLVGYLSSGTFLTNANEKTLSGAGAYEDIDLSGDSPPSNTIAAVVQVYNSVSYGNWALRKDGSSDDLYKTARNHIFAVVGLTSSIFEAKVSSTNEKAYILGYLVEEKRGTVSEEVGIADTFEGDSPYRDFSEEVGIADTFEGDSPHRDFTDNIGISDDFIGTLAEIQCPFTENIGLGDTVDAYRYWEKNIPTEGVGVADAFEGEVYQESRCEESLSFAEVALGGMDFDLQLADSNFFGDWPSWGWGKDIADTFSIVDATDKILGLQINEIVKLQELITVNYNILQLLIEDRLPIDDDTSCFMGIYKTLADAFSVVDAVPIALQLIITEYLKLSEALSNLGSYTHVNEETITFLDEVQRGWLLSIADALSVVDVSTATYFAYCLIADTVSAVDAAPGNYIRISPVIEDGAGFAEALTVGQALYNLVQDGVSFLGTLVLDEEIYQAWVFNTTEFKPSVYSNFSFNSYCMFNDKAYGAKSDGIYLLEGSDDQGAAIHPGILLNTSHFGVRNKKRFRKAFFGLSGTRPTLKVEDDTGTIKYYEITNDKATISRALKGHEFIFSLSDFDVVDFIELIPVVLGGYG